MVTKKRAGHTNHNMKVHDGEKTALFLVPGAAEVIIIGLVVAVFVAFIVGVVALSRLSPPDGVYARRAQT